MAGEEAEAQLASGGPPETDAVAEFYYMREQERAVLQHQAANYRDWETWEMDQGRPEELHDERDTWWSRWKPGPPPRAAPRSRVWGDRGIWRSRKPAT